MLTCESDFNINYNKIVGRDENHVGGSYLDEFVLSNIISVFFLNKFVDMKRHNLNGFLPINMDGIDNLIGILAHKKTIGTSENTSHAVSFYKYFSCNKFCNNSNIINYDWEELFNTYNSSLRSKLKPKIFYDTRQTHPPILKGTSSEGVEITIPVEQRPCEGSRGITLTSTDLSNSKFKEIGDLYFFSFTQFTDPQWFKMEYYFKYIYEYKLTFR